MNVQVISLAFLIALLTAVSIYFTIRNLRKNYAAFYHIKRLNITADEHISQIAYDIQNKLNMNKKIPVIQHQGIDVPAIGGFFHPIIFLPKKEWTDKELRYILEHECIHYCHGDVWLKLFFILVKSFYWWNLPLQYLFMCFDQACEYHVDHAVVKNRQKKLKIEYGQTILNALTYIQDREKNFFHRMFATSAFVLPDDKNFVYERIELFVQKEPRTATPIKTLLVVGCSFLFTATSLAYIPLEDQTPIVETTSGEYLYLVDKHDGSYDMYLDGILLENITGTRESIEAGCSKEYIFDEVPDLETVKNIGR